jgi:hypothetical protein
MRANQGAAGRPLGQALLFEVSADDIVVAAVPDTPVLREFAEDWRERPLVRRAGPQDRPGRPGRCGLLLGPIVV